MILKGNGWNRIDHTKFSLDTRIKFIRVSVIDLFNLLSLQTKILGLHEFDCAYTRVYYNIEDYTNQTELY